MFCENNTWDMLHHESNTLIKSNNLFGMFPSHVFSFPCMPPLVCSHLTLFLPPSIMRDIFAHTKHRCGERKLPQNVSGASQEVANSVFVGNLLRTIPNVSKNQSINFNDCCIHVLLNSIYVGRQSTIFRGRRLNLIFESHRPMKPPILKAYAGSLRISRLEQDERISSF